MKLIGVILIVFGIVALAVGGINYTRREKVLDIGPVTAVTEKHESIPLSPIAGIAALVAAWCSCVAGSRDAGVDGILNVRGLRGSNYIDGAGPNTSSIVST